MVHRSFPPNANGFLDHVCNSFFIFSPNQILDRLTNFYNKSPVSILNLTNSQGSFEKALAA
jgi:hypothetical protein